MRPTIRAGRRESLKSPQDQKLGMASLGTILTPVESRRSGLGDERLRHQRKFLRQKLPMKAVRLNSTAMITIGPICASTCASEGLPKMKVEQLFNGSWVVRDDDGLVVNSFKTNGEAWRWLERNEMDPLWVKSSRQNREQVEPHRRKKEQSK